MKGKLFLALVSVSFFSFDGARANGNYGQRRKIEHSS